MTTTPGLISLATGCIITAGALAQASNAQADILLQSESKRIVSQHHAVFAKLPAGVAPFTTDAVLLGNGDVTMSISSPRLEKGSPLKKPDPASIRLWFHKNDLWAHLFATADLSFQFDPAKGEPKCRLETDLYTATTTGTLTQDGGVTVRFNVWVSAVDNLIVLDLVADNGTINYALTPQVMKEKSVAQQRDLPAGDGAYLCRSFPTATPPVGVSMCLRRFGPGHRGVLDHNRQTYVFALDSLLKNPQYATAVETKMAAFDHRSLTACYAAHQRWWAGFWAASWVEMPDKVIEKQYYLANYLLASCCRDKDFPPGILGSWFCTDGPGWNNDCHLNYNYQAGFYSLYGGNHVALGEVQDQPLLDYMDHGRQLADQRLKMPGILYPVGIGPKGATTCGSDFGQKTNAAYGAVNMIFRWKTTYDPAYAKKVYPYFKELTTFWEAYLTFEQDKDRYAIENDAIHENSGKDYNSIVSLALVRAVFGAALEMGAALGMDTDKREQWNHILTHLSPYATREAAGKTVFRYAETGTEYWKDNTLGIQHIYPTLGIGLESSPELIRISHNTLELMQRWFDNNGDTSFFPAAACLAWQPDTIYQKLHEYVATLYRPNGMRNNKHGLEKVSTIPNTVNLMLCSVHQDVMRVFPAWPKSVDAKFANLRQFGAFLVAGELKDGAVQYVRVTSEQGRDLTLVNPWPGQPAKVLRDGKPSATLQGTKLIIKTQPGSTLVLTPDGAR